MPRKARPYKHRRCPYRPSEEPEKYFKWYYENVTKKKRKKKKKKKKKGRKKK